MTVRAVLVALVSAALLPWSVPAADDLHEQLFGRPRPTEAKPAPRAAPNAPGSAEKPTTGGENPLGKIALKMQQSENLLAGSETGEKTQQVQKEIVAAMDELLAGGDGAAGSSKTASKPQPQPKPDGAKPSDRPGDKPSEQPSQGENKPGEAHRPDMAEMKRTMQGLWGALLPREQEEMFRTTPPERFLPKYERMIEDYYKRLAAERSGKESP